MLRITVNQSSVKAHFSCAVRRSFGHDEYASSSLTSGPYFGLRRHTVQQKKPRSPSVVSNRYFSSDPSQISNSERVFNDSSMSVDETLDKLFAESQINLASSTTESWNAAVEAAWDPTWYNVADQAVMAVKNFHNLTGIEYGWSIVGVTVILRLCLFPLMVMSQQTTSRMAHLQPELQHMKQRYEALGTPSRQDQIQFGQKMKALFAKYQVKPFRAFVAPVVQIPLFIGMFFGLRKMPQLFPEELSTGGMFWFTDLTAADPNYILPLATAGTFLAVIEMGRDQMMAQNKAQGELMLNIFRVLSITMIPVCISFETSMLVYWTSNNLLTMTQTGILKLPSVRKYFGIWDPPLPVPGQETPSLTQSMSSLADRLQGKATTDAERIQRHNQEVENKNRAFQRLRQTKPKGKGITGTKAK